MATMGTVLAACAPGVPVVVGPQATSDLTSEVQFRQPSAKDGRCWHETVQPAIFETVTVQALVTPAVVDASGRLLEPAVFRTETRQSEVRPRQTGWFRIPCAGELAGDGMAFTASLQRALKARGLFGGEISGQSDAATRAAVLAFQRRFGLESDVLSFAAARMLGLVSTVSN